MSLQFILGGSGSGKTRILYEWLIKESISNPGQQYIAVVPEQFTMQTQKEIVTLHPNHGTMNIDIVSFQRLAYRIFEELAIENPMVLDDMGKSMVLRKVASEKKNSLGYFKGNLNKPGFISCLKSMISELLQYGITDEMLKEMVPQAGSDVLSHKLKDLTVLYQGFKEGKENCFITAEEILSVLCDCLEKSEIIKNSVVTLDGYTGFTPVQYRLLELMIRYCKKVVVTVTVDPSDHPYQRTDYQDLFYMSKLIVSKLDRIAEKNGVYREADVRLERHPYVRFGDRKELDFLEQNIFRYGAAPYDGEWKDGEDSPLSLYQAASPQDEVAFVAAGIHKMLQENGLRYRDIAVITGDLAGYRPQIIQQFIKNEIPYFMDDKKSILENPMVELIRSALEVLQKDFAYESVFRYIKTGLVWDDMEQADRMENYVIALGIRGFKRWNSIWEWEYKGSHDLNLLELNYCKNQILEPLCHLREAFREEGITVRGMAAALVSFLEECQVEKKMQQFQEYFESQGQLVLAKEYSQVYQLVMDLFDRLVGLLGKEKVSRKEFGEILDAGFEEIKVGVIPATVDRVVVGDLTRTRLDHIKVLFFVGVNDGIVPSKKTAGNLLTDKEREFLGAHNIELAPTSTEDGFMQRFYLYLMLAKPSQKLILSYTALNSQGKSQRPSHIINEIRALFPKLEVRECGTEDGMIHSIQEGKRQLTQGLRRFREKPDDHRFMELYRWFFNSPEHKEQLRALVDAASFVYRERGIGKAAAQALYGTVLNGSVTRLEQYAACAYAHFLKYGLELTERQEYTLAAVDLGNLFHNSIDRCFKTLEEQQKSFRDISVEERKQLVKTCVEAVTGEYGNTILQSSARNAYLAARVEKITDRTIWALSEQLKKGDFEPAGFEVSFSSIDNLTAMKIALSNDESLHLKGRIDRLDTCVDDGHVYVKIIDYKSGSTSFDLVSLYYGLQLQLVVYMDAVMELEERKHPEKEVVPAGIFYYNIKDPMVEKEAGENPDEETIEQRILKQLRMNGLVNSELEVIKHLDHEIEKESDVIPVAMKDGVIQEARSSVANRRRFEALKGYVREKVKETGREILGGQIQVNPYQQGTKTACDYCPYHPVCGFDKKTDGYQYRKFKSMKPEEIWGEIEETPGKEKPSCQ